MTVRDMIRIDEDKCDGCGDCVVSCEEGAIRIIDGKARLVSDVYCDGLGACIGSCPQGALTIEKREAPDFDEDAVKAHLAKMIRAELSSPSDRPAMAGCPGSATRTFAPPSHSPAAAEAAHTTSQLGQWPVQLMLVPPHAPFLQGADLLVCADCVPFAVPDFHTRHLANRAILVGCPKLDNLEFYYQKLAAIFSQASPRRITVLRMEVPCCGGIADAAIDARDKAAPETPVEIHTVGVQGGISGVGEPAGGQGPGARFEL